MAKLLKFDELSPEERRNIITLRWIEYFKSNPPAVDLPRAGDKTPEIKDKVRKWKESLK